MNKVNNYPVLPGTKKSGKQEFSAKTGRVLGKLRKLVTLDTNEEKLSGLKDDVDKSTQNSSKRDIVLKYLEE